MIKTHIPWFWRILFVSSPCSQEGLQWVQRFVLLKRCFMFCLDASIGGTNPTRSNHHAGDVTRCCPGYPAMLPSMLNGGEVNERVSWICVLNREWTYVPAMVERCRELCELWALSWMIMMGACKNACFYTNKLIAISLFLRRVGRNGRASLGPRPWTVQGL